MTPLDWVLIDAFVRSFENGAENQAFGERMKRLRRLILWRLFGSKESYRKLRHEHAIGWHTFPSARILT